MASEHTTEALDAPERDSAERFDPRAMGGGLMEAEHRARYWWAAPLADGREVLDAGCGTGYGLQVLAAREPARLVGVDVSPEALDRARQEVDEAAELVEADVREMPFEADSFDLVVCFEVIEHVERQEEALAEVRRVLRPGGMLVISSPNRAVYAPGNPHHVHEYLPEELRGALTEHFPHVVLHGQHVWLATAIAAHGALRAGEPSHLLTATVNSLEAGAETYTLAIASDEKLEDRAGLVALGDAFEARWWHEQLAGAREELDRALRMQEDRALRMQKEARANEARLSGRVMELEQEVARVRQLEHDLEAVAAAAARREDELQAQLAFHGQVIEDMKASPSWRLTAPLRALKRLLGH